MYCRISLYVFFIIWYQVSLKNNLLKFYVDSVGSLGNHNGNAKDDVDKTNNFYCASESRESLLPIQFVCWCQNYPELSSADYENYETQK